MLLYRQKTQVSAIYNLKLDFASSGGHHRQKMCIRDSSERMDKLKTQYPVIDKMNEGSGEIRMTSEEHRAYVDYLNLARQMEDMERQHIYFRGHTDAVAYLKKIKAI